MTLLIQQVSLTDFRNHHDLAFSLDAGVTIFVGDNAVGKTNIVEALQLVTMMESFRKPRNTELIAEGAASAYVSIELSEHTPEDEVGRQGDIKMMVSTKRQYALNSKKKSSGEIKGYMPSVLFTPDDLDMIKGPAGGRRQALDMLGTQLSKTYVSLKADYEKVLKQRNALLKDLNQNPGLSPGILDAWDESLISLGALYHIHRKNLFDRIKQVIIPHFKELSPYEDLDMTYQPSWEKDEVDVGIPPGGEFDKSTVEQALREALVSMRPEELRRMKTLVGPHRDEISFFIDGRDARLYGSQGQQRTIVLAWKLAEVDVIWDVLGVKPLMLLDDVMSELDDKRRGALSAFIHKLPQTCITTTNLKYFTPEFLESAHILQLPYEPPAHNEEGE